MDHLKDVPTDAMFAPEFWKKYMLPEKLLEANIILDCSVSAIQANEMSLIMTTKVDCELYNGISQKLAYTVFDSGRPNQNLNLFFKKA